MKRTKKKKKKRGPNKWMPFRRPEEGEPAKSTPSKSVAQREKSKKESSKKMKTRASMMTKTKRQEKKRNLELGLKALAVRMEER